MSASLCAVHTHSNFCDGKDSPEAMAAAAYRAGVKHFGFSSHSHTPVPDDEGAVLPADMSAYKNCVLSLRETYRGQMEILLGLEWDSRSDVGHAGFDYWIGSVHHLYLGGVYWPVDWSEERFLRCRDERFAGDAFALAREYYKDVAAVAAMRPTILGHIDLIGKFNEDNRLFDEEEPRYRRAARDALHAADPGETLLEINTGAMARGYRAKPYPAQFLLREWREMGGNIILTSDSHSAENICFAYAEAAQWAKAAGFDHAVLLTMDGARKYDL